MASETQVELFNCPNYEYHAMDGVSHSQREDFRVDPALYEGRHITGEYPRIEPTPMMLLGAAIDDAVCGDELAKDSVVWDKPRTGNAWFDFVEEHCDGTYAGAQRRGWAQWKTWVEQSRNVHFLSSKEYQAFTAIVAQFRDLPLKGINQACVAWQEHNLMQARARADIWDEQGDGGRAILWDVKCTEINVCDTRAIARHIWERGYHRQLEWYARGFQRMTEKEIDCRLVFCGVKPPYRIWMYRPNDVPLSGNKSTSMTFMDAAALQNDVTTAEMVACINSGHWEPSGYMELRTVEPPRYVNYEGEYA
jgi:hypothetical protein